MGMCELCGKSGDLFLTEIEGSKMRVCKGCSKAGKLLQRPSMGRRFGKQGSNARIQTKEEKEDTRIIGAKFAEKIHKKRTETKRTQEEFAKSLNIKESLLQKIESGQVKPSIALAEKLERALHIKLIEDLGEEKNTSFSTQKRADKKETAREFTIGDFIKVRERKK